MSYRCQVCNTKVKAGTPLQRYTAYRTNKQGHREIAREIPACEGCLGKLNSGTPLTELQPTPPTFVPPVPAPSVAYKPTFLGAPVMRKR